MGRVRLVGGASSKEYQILEETSGEIKIKNATDGVDLLKASSTTVTDASGVSLKTHGDRHRADGGDPSFMVPFGSDITVSVDAGGTYTIPRGMHYVKCGANTKAQIYIEASWQDYSSVGALILIVSDGSNARLNNTGAAGENSTLKRVA
jgi:hypothetical protein